jgi:hypothetical protein
MLGSLSAAIQVVAEHGQLPALEKRVRQEHPSKRAHREGDDDRLLDCLTEACAFAWAALRQLGTPQFDYKAGRPDVHVPPDTWIEAKAVHPSQASNEEMALMMAGEISVGYVAPPGQNRGLNFLSSLQDALKKFTRLGNGQWIVFFNLPSVDVNQIPDRAAVLSRYVALLNAQEQANPGVRIVFCEGYDWRAPRRDPFRPKP